MGWAAARGYYLFSMAVVACLVLAGPRRDGIRGPPELLDALRLGVVLEGVEHGCRVQV